MAIYHLNSYRDVIQQKLREHANHKGYKGYISQKMGIQTSHFSQVLIGKIDLTPDQGSKLCDEWQFNDTEADYFINLIHLERSTTTSLKRRIRKHLESLRHPLAEGYEVKVIGQNRADQDMYPFYASWIYPAVYAALKIKGNTTEEQVVKRLALPTSTVRDTLLGLEKMKLVEKRENEWVTTHLGIVNNTRHTQSIAQWELRNKAHQLYAEGDTEMVRFSSLSIVPKEKFFEFKERVQKFIEEFHNEAWAIYPDPDEIMVMNIDFFRIGRSSPEA